MRFTPTICIRFECKCNLLPFARCLLHSIGGCWNNALKTQFFIEFKEIPGFRIVTNILVTILHRLPWQNFIMTRVFPLNSLSIRFLSRFEWIILISFNTYTRIFQFRMKKLLSKLKIEICWIITMYRSFWNY